MLQIFKFRHLGRPLSYILLTEIFHIALTRHCTQTESSKNIHSGDHEPTESSKQPIRARYLCHVTGYQPIRDQHFLIRSVPGGDHTATL